MGFLSWSKSMNRAVAKARALAIHLIYERTILLLTVIFCVGMGATLWHLSRLSPTLVE
jgi:hypothetical protein